jgi:hypothetical protein
MLTLLFILGINEMLQAQEFSELDKSPLDISYYPSRAAFRALAGNEAEKKANEPVIRVLYSRPQKKGRDVFGGLVPYEKIWRAGANESSEIMFFRPVEIGGKALPADRYSFYVNPKEDEWEVIFNSDLDNWGAYAYNPEKNVASVTVPTETMNKGLETFSIAFEETEEGANMLMGWDKTMVRVPIKFEK